MGVDLKGQRSVAKQRRKTMFAPDQPDLFGAKGRWCAYCGGEATTSDHVPARVLLDKPYPPDLLTVPSCESCNNGKSSDEQYMSCVLDAVLSGSADPARLLRDASRKALLYSPRLRQAIENHMEVSDGRVITYVDVPRVERVLKHIGAGHLWKARCRTFPASKLICAYKPLLLMDREERLAFEYGEPERLLWPTRGSRRPLKGAREYLYDEDYLRQLRWHELQEKRYSYAIFRQPWVEVRMVFADYLGCRVWMPKPFAGSASGRFKY